MPESVENLVILSEIKLLAASRRIAKVEVKDRKLMLTRGGDFILVAGKFPRLVKEDAASRLREVLELVRSV
jgi:transcription-repair coupling factor (superfamily II helicase)